MSSSASSLPYENPSQVENLSASYISIISNSYMLMLTIRDTESISAARLDIWRRMQCTHMALTEKSV